MKTLVTVAQKAKARFFTHEPGEALQEIETLTHPESALHEGDLITDSRTMVSERNGPQMRAAQPEHTAKETEATRFAIEVADKVRTFRLSNDFGRAVVVAAPQFMGLLRDKLDPADKKFVEIELTKNIADEDEATIAKHLGEVMRV